MDEVSRVMILTPDFGYGGAERSVAAVSRLLAPHYQVHVVVFNKEIDQVYTVGGTLHSLEVKKGSTLVKKLWAFFQRLYKLKRLKKKLQIKLCLSFLEGADYLNILTRAESKVIINIRGSKKYDANIAGVFGWFRKKVLIPALYNKADAITVVSEGLKHELITDFNISKQRPIVTIPNFCNSPEVLKLAEEYLPNERKLLSFPTLVTVGRIAYEKGYDLFARVFAKLVQAIPRAKWVIVGSGPFQNQLQEVLNAENLVFSDYHDENPESHVWFTGYQQNPYKWISRCSVFVLPSRTEGFPNALLEALAIGKPVVAADCPYGPADILGNKTSRLFENEFGLLMPGLSEGPRIVDAWCEKLKELLGNPQLRAHYAEQAKNRASHYAPGLIESHWVKLIAQYV